MKIRKLLNHWMTKVTHLANDNAGIEYKFYIAQYGGLFIVIYLKTLNNFQFPDPLCMYICVYNCVCIQCV